MKKDGGPAFPTEIYDFQPTTGQQVVRDQQFGLTKRQWYAGMAMQGLIASTTNSDDWPASTLVAQKSFEMADAMLAFEEKEAGEKE